MISSAPIGTGRAASSHRRTGNGRDSSPAADIINGAAMVAEFNLSSTEQDSATFSKRFSAAAVAVPLSVGLAGARQRPSAARMSRPTSWSHSKKRCTDRPEQFHFAGLARIRWKTIRSRFRAVFMKDSESVYAVRAKRAHAEEKAAT